MWDGDVPPPSEKVAAARETAEEPEEPISPKNDGSAAVAPLGLLRGLHFGGAVADLSLPSRAIEYNKYRH